MNSPLPSLRNGRFPFPFLKDKGISLEPYLTSTRLKTNSLL